MNLLKQRLLAALLALVGVLLAIVAGAVADLGGGALATAALSFGALYMALSAAVVNSRR